MAHDLTHQKLAQGKEQSGGTFHLVNKFILLCLQKNVIVQIFVTSCRKQRILTSVNIYLIIHIEVFQNGLFEQRPIHKMRLL